MPTWSIHLAAIVGASACERDPAPGDQRQSRSRSSCSIGCAAAINCVIYPNTNSGYGITSGASYLHRGEPAASRSLCTAETKVEAEQRLLQQPNTIALRLATVFGMSPRMRLDLLVNHFVYTA